MIVTQNLKMDLDRPGSGLEVSAVCGDQYTRRVCLALYENGVEWCIPEELSVTVWYEKADGTGGVYDTLPNGQCAWSGEGNCLTILLAPQMMTAPGVVRVQLELGSGEQILHSFGFYLRVSDMADEASSEPYVNWRASFLPQIRNGEPGQYIRIVEVDSSGQVISADSVTPEGAQGEAGQDGVSPVVAVSEIPGGSRITITDVNGTQSVDVMDGETGPQGPQGETGPQGPQGETGAQGPQGEAGADAQKALAGKTVVCFGDSLFGMYRGDTSAPAYIAAHTGATVYNVGFGGTRMSVHPYDGYAQFSMWALADAVADGDFTEQEAHAAEGSDYFAEQLEVLKSIDFSAVDMAVIHFGTNDFTGNVPLDDGTEAYTTVCGALRYSLGRLLTAYPRLRIFVSLPVFRCWTADDGTVTWPEGYTNGNGITLPAVCTALAAAAREYGIPVLDGYHGLGINRFNAAKFYTDGTHHNEAGRERFGVFLGAGLIAQGAAMAEYGSDDGGTDSGGDDEETTAYTNQIPISTDTDGSVFNGVGYQSGYRLSSSGALSAYAGLYVTGFIPVKYLDLVYLKNVTHNSGEDTAANQRIALYDADKTFIAVSGATATAQLLKQYDSDGNLVRFQVANIDSTDMSGAAYFRICGSYIGADSVITVNEVIE